MAFLQAKDVGLIEALKEPVSGINKKRQSSLQGRIGGISDQAKANMLGRGVAKSDYIPEQISQAGEMGSRGIEDALLGALGESSLGENKKQREHEANLALIEEISALSKPSVLQQVLGGLSGAAQAGAQFGGLYQALGKNKAGMEYADYRGPRPSYTSKLDLLNYRPRESLMRGGY